MAKVKMYLRVAETKRGYSVAASSKPNYEPISTQGGYNQPRNFRPTVAFAVDFIIPDELFAQAERTIGEINVGIKDAQVAAEVEVPSLKVKTKKWKNK